MGGTPAGVCEHQYVLLRQAINVTKQFDDRVLEREIGDLYYCSKCLDYKTIYLRTEVPSTRGYGWVEKWGKP